MMMRPGVGMCVVQKGRIVVPGPPGIGMRVRHCENPRQQIPGIHMALYQYLEYQKGAWLDNETCEF